MVEHANPAIGLDLMGGDNAPESNIGGCLMALEQGISIVAYGSNDAVNALKTKGDHRNLHTETCPDVISLDESPLQAVRDKPGSTIRKGIEDVRDGRSSAFVSAGSTGALVAGGVILLGRAKGVDKPCLAMVLPSRNPRGVLALDLGASADARPQTLVQYAVMGDVYARKVLGWQEPGVYLLNIGAEPEKGSIASRKAHSLLKDAPLNFRGNIEARDIFAGKADIVVTDGFTGNVLIKACEGTAEFQMEIMKAELSAGILSKAAAYTLKPAMRRVRRVLDYSTYGGAPLLGLQGCVVKCHGSSGPKAIANGIAQAWRFSVYSVSRVISDTLSKSPSEGE